nr:hypothetical protein CDS [Bradyrhizobium sp.]
MVVTLGDRRQLIHVLLTRLRYAVQIEEELSWRRGVDTRICRASPMPTFVKP